MSQAGGKGIAIQVDHLVTEQVETLVARIRTEQGRLDILINDVWGGETLKEWDKPVWGHNLENGLRLLDLGVRTHLITTHFALPLLIERPGGLLVEVTDGAEVEPDANVKVASGFIETSNVNIASTLVDMIEFQRQFEVAVRMMQTADQNAARAADLASIS